MKELTELFGFLVFVLLIWFIIDTQNHPEYYTTCLGGGQSYVQCFYDHTIKIKL